MASSNADCTFAGARLISSASSTGVKIGPRRMLNSCRSFWDRAYNHPVYGFQEMHFEEVYPPDQSLGLGSPDPVVYDYFVDKLAAEPDTNTFSLVISLSSGRMSITYASECLRKFFGPEVFNHTGSVNLKFLRPVKGGDSVTVTGSVVDRQAVGQGTQVTVELKCTNQNGDTTAVGQGMAIVP